MAGGATACQIFVGTDSTVLDAYGMNTDAQFVNTLEDNICFRGAPAHLISDNAQSETSNHVKDILHALFIPSWMSEPHHQHQNPCEHHIQQLKHRTNIIMDRTNTPAPLWLLAVLYVCFLLINVIKAAQWQDSH